MVQGETEEEVEMVDLFKQVLAADSRGVISSFALSIMVCRYWGKDHKENDTSLVTIAKTEKQLTAWMHPDHFVRFTGISRDHHDLIHNGFLALTMVVTNMKTLLITGNKVGGGITLWTPFPKTQAEYVLRTPTVSYQSVWNTQEQQKSQYSSDVTKYARLLLETPMIDWKGKKGTYHMALPYTLVVPTASPEVVSINTPAYS